MGAKGWGRHSSHCLAPKSSVVAEKDLGQTGLWSRTPASPTAGMFSHHSQAGKTVPACAGKS